MNNNQILLMVLIILFTLLIGTIIFYILAKASIMFKRYKLDEYEININSVIDDNILSLLDKIIADCFAEYTVLNIDYKDIVYVDAELEKDITKQVCYKVSERISPALLAKISLSYNMDNFSKLLSERVYLHTLNYAMQKNKPK
ncbi:MAG: hypothetical protein ACRDD7_14660 [Peptostreptococcaceae bacterium]